MEKGQSKKDQKKKLNKISESKADQSDEGEWDDLSDDQQPESQGILYKVLNVKPEATMQEIRESYKLLARTLHPDKN